MPPSHHALGTMGSGSTSEVAHLFAALGDETRLRMVSRLCREGPLSITKLASDSEMSRQAITKHLRMMGRRALCKARGPDAKSSGVWMKSTWKRRAATST